MIASRIVRNFFEKSHANQVLTLQNTEGFVPVIGCHYVWKNTPPNNSTAYGWADSAKPARVKISVLPPLSKRL